MAFDLKQYGIDVKNIRRNRSTSSLYEVALRTEEGSAMSSVGALMCYSGEKTGRSPKDKRIVRNPESENNIGLCLFFVVRRRLKKSIFQKLAIMFCPKFRRSVVK